MPELGEAGSDTRSGHADVLSGEQPRLLQLLDFDRPQGGSFVPIIGAMLGEAISRGWKAGAVLFEGCEELPWIGDLRAGGAEVHFVPRGRDRVVGEALREVLDGHDGPNVMHSHFSGFDMPSLVAGRGRPHDVIVWHVHSVLPRDIWRLSRATIKFGLLGRSVDAFFCPAQNIVDSTIRRRARRDRVKFVPSAIDVGRFRPADAEFRRTAKQNIGVPADRTTLLHFGWHRYWKGGDIFVEVVKELVDRGVDVIALERGGDEEYTQHAEELGIGEYVQLVAPTDDVRELHACADLFLAPSRTEGMAYAIIETLAVGTPVVATGIPGHAFLAEHMSACRATRLDATEIADAVQEMLGRDPERVERDRTQAERWIADNLSIEVVAARVVDDYEPLLAARA